MTFGEREAKLAAAIAAALGEQWEAEGHYLYGPSAAELWLSLTWGGPGRLYIEGLLPREYRARYGTAAPKFSIKCSPEREPEAIAREIERRLLPEYEPALEQARKTIVEWEEGSRGAEDFLVAIGRLAKVERQYTANPREYSATVRVPGAAHCEVSLFDGDHCAITLRGVPTAKAQEILRLLAPAQRLCAGCRLPVESDRAGWYAPACHACLPPPPPLAVLQILEASSK